MQYFGGSLGLAACAAGVIVSALKAYVISSHPSQASDVQQDPEPSGTSSSPDSSPEGNEDGQAYKVLKEEYDDMKTMVELLRKEQALEREHYRILWSRYEMAMASVAEAEEKSKLAVEHNNQLEYENSFLIEQVRTLEESVGKLEKQLCGTRKDRVKLKKNTLEHENNTLKDYLTTLRDNILRLEEELRESHNMCMDILSEKERLTQRLLSPTDENTTEQMTEQQYYNILWLRYQKAMSTLATTTKTAKLAIECNTQLEYENSFLLEQVHVLEDSLEVLERQLFESRRARIKLKKNILESENASLKNQIIALEESVMRLEGQLHETRRICKEIMDEEQEDDRTFSFHNEDNEAEKSSENDLESSVLLGHETSRTDST